MKNFHFFNKGLITLLCSAALVSACNDSMVTDGPDVVDAAGKKQATTLSAAIAENTVARFGKEDRIMNVKSEEDAQKRLAELISPFAVTSSRGENNEEEYTVKDATGTYKVIYLLAPEDPDYFAYALVRDSADKTIKTIKFGKPGTRGTQPGNINLWDAVHLTGDQLEARPYIVYDRKTKDYEKWGKNELNALCIKKTNDKVTILYLSKETYDAADMTNLPNVAQMKELGSYLRSNRTVFESRWKQQINLPVNFDTTYWLGEKCKWGTQRRTGTLNGKISSDIFVFAYNNYLLCFEASSDVFVFE